MYIYFAQKLLCLQYVLSCSTGRTAHVYIRYQYGVQHRNKLKTQSESKLIDAQLSRSCLTVVECLCGTSTMRDKKRSHWLMEC